MQVDLGKEIGKKHWVFPDGELPPEGEFELKGHESIIILNLCRKDARIRMNLYFVDKPPLEGIEITVDSRRVRCLRMDDLTDFCDYEIERESQYSIELISDVPIVVQYGRLDTRNQPMAFYAASGFSE